MGVDAPPRAKGYLIQILMIIAINVPTVSFGLALGWVSLVSGESAGADAEAADGALVGAAAATFAAGLLGVPLAARALAFGRKPALIATSAMFAVCWSLKLCGGGGVVAARAAAGVAGAAAWCVAPLLGNEVCGAGLQAAAAAAPVVAHNLGFLLMYAAADLGLQHRTVEWCCLLLSVAHCAAFLAAPESPAFLAANGHREAAVSALAALRGAGVEHPAVAVEAAALPPPEDAARRSLLALLRDMVSEPARARAFVIVLVAVVGQESCGVLTLMQFAERVFMMARDEGKDVSPAGEDMSPARRALLLGAVQFLTSLLGLYLVERLDRRRLLIWGSFLTCAGLAAGSAAVAGGQRAVAVASLAVAVAADSAALQPAPYALLGDMFDYQYMWCAVAAVMAAGSAGNAAETLALPAVARAAGVWAALATSAALTALYAAFVCAAVPVTRARSLADIYACLALPRRTVCTKL